LSCIYIPAVTLPEVRAAQTLNYATIVARQAPQVQVKHAPSIATPHISYQFMFDAAYHVLEVIEVMPYFITSQAYTG